MSETTCAAQLTAFGRGAIAVVQLIGPAAFSSVSQFCRGLREPEAEAATQIFVRDWGGDHAERVVLQIRSTETVEVHCHGGRMAARRILSDLQRVGVRSKSWNELVVDAPKGTHRAGICGGDFADDRLSRQAIVALSRASTERTARILLDQCSGAFGKKAVHLRRSVSLGNLSEARRLVDELLQFAHVGMHLVEPWEVVLVGQPNSGKSSLVNKLAGFQRVIVDADAGTTRDLVSVPLAIDGWPVTIVDSAGIRDRAGQIEGEGVARALERVARSDLQLVIIDSTCGTRDEDRAIIDRCSRPLVVWNKSDLMSVDLQAHTEPVVSALTGAGIDVLLNRIARHLVPDAPPEGLAIPFLLEHVQFLELVRDALENDSEKLIEIFGNNSQWETV